MTHLNVQLEPGEISLVLAEDANVLARHACQVSKFLIDRGMNVQLVNCGMTNRRFWKVAREEVGEQLDLKGRQTKVALRTMIRGNLYSEHDILKTLRTAYKTKVVIIFGWEWTSKSWKLKEDLIFHLREAADEENVAVIIYSQARTSPKLGRFDRGGVGRLSSIAIDIDRVDDEDKDDDEGTSSTVIDTNPPTNTDTYAEEPDEVTEFSEMSEMTVDELLESAQLSYNKNNHLDRVRHEEGEPFERDREYA